jgi:cytochrome c oxidase subunit I
MRRPSKRLIQVFLASLAVGYLLSGLIMVGLDAELRHYGFLNLTLIAFLVAILISIILDSRMDLRIFDWPEPIEAEVGPRYSDVAWRVWSWMTTVDHKRIGLMYISTALVFLIAGGIEALLLRLQLSGPSGTILDPDLYNQLLTMHGTTMVFLVVMPLLAGLANYVVILMVGARDMAFPRLNALGIWLVIFGGLLLYTSFLAGGAPDAGWFAYAPLSGKTFAPTHGMDFWVMGLALLGVSSIATAINFVVTILRMRAPGLTMNRLPIFVWTVLVQSFLILFAFPTFTVATILLFLDRSVGTNFYLAEAGGDPLLWQHLFWFFGHPEVYIMILPAMGIISEIIPVFSRKPIFGYIAIAYSTVAIGFLGFSVWAHHMFAVGMPVVANSAFAATSMLIAVPTAIKIFNWIATLWGGSIRFTTPLYFAVGFVAMFIIGGLSGIMLATVPIDLQVTDTYFVVAHLHYVLFGGSLFGIFGGIYYWFPKMTGRLLAEGLGKVHFWLMLVGFNLTFFPMHVAGLLGMPRRIYTYAPGLGWEVYNLAATIGAFVMTLAIIVFFGNVVLSLVKPRVAADDPWDAWTLEWATTSPPPPHNFDVIPPVNSRRPLWDLKHPEAPDRPVHRLPRRLMEAEGRLVPAGVAAEIHLPPSSYWPITMAAGLTLVLAGLIFTPIGTLAGLVVFAVATTGWVRQPVH